MTVSFAKGKKSESSMSHNERSLNSKFNFEKTGHKHIKKDFTHLNEVLIHKNLKDVYDEEFTDAIIEYNKRQNRADRRYQGVDYREYENLPKYAKKDLTLDSKETRQQQFLLDEGGNEVDVLTDTSTVLALGLTVAKELNKTKVLTDEDLSEFSVASSKTLSILQARSKQAFSDYDDYTRQHENAHYKASSRTLGESLLRKQQQGKQTAPYVEFIVQTGNIFDYNRTNSKGQLVDEDGKSIDGTDPETIAKKAVSLDREDPSGAWQKAKKRLEKYAMSFEKRHKALKVVSASIHMDEASPHLHLDCVPVAETPDAKSGLKRRPSFNKALVTEYGKKGSNKERFKRFCEDEEAELTKLLQLDGLDRRKGKTNNYKNVHQFKEAMADINRSKQKAIEDVQNRTESEKSKQIAIKKEIDENLIPRRNSLKADVDEKQVKKEKLDEEIKQRQKSREELEAKIALNKQKITNLQSFLYSQMSNPKEAKKKHLSIDKMVHEIQSNVETKKAEIVQMSILENDKITKRQNEFDNYYTTKSDELTLRESKLNEYKTSLDARESNLSARENKLSAKLKTIKSKLKTRLTNVRVREEAVSKRESDVLEAETNVISRATKFKHYYAAAMVDNNLSEETQEKVIKSYIYSDGLTRKEVRKKYFSHSPLKRARAFLTAVGMAYGQDDYKEFEDLPDSLEAVSDDLEKKAREQGERSIKHQKKFDDNEFEL